MKRLLFIICTIVALSGCGGGGSDSTSGGSESADDALRYYYIREIQHYIRNENYQPTQAEIDCVAALPSTDDIDLHGQRVIDCVNNN